MAFRVLVDTQALTRPGRDRGLGRYVRQLLVGLHARGVPYEEISVASNAGRLSEWTELVRRTIRLGIPTDNDIYHATTPYSAACWPRTRTVVTVHDLIPLELIKYVKTGTKARYFYHRASRASSILTYSAFTKARLETVMGVSPDRIYLAPLPAPREIREFSHRECVLPKGLPDDGFVVGMADTRKPDDRKRIPWLMGLGTRLTQSGHPMIVAGPGTDAPHLVRYWRGLGQVSDRVWADVLWHARVLVYTSAYEGQGLPPLEAMTLGTPVVGMANTSLPEVVAGGGILLQEDDTPQAAVNVGCEPDDKLVDRLFDAVLAVIEDDALHESLAARGRRHAASFSEHRFMDGVLQAYTHTAKGI